MLLLPAKTRRDKSGRMRENGAKFFLNLVLMLAFIGAGISPACKFISGEMVEICGPNGVEMVRLNADELPPTAPDHHKQVSEQCAFCFAGSHIKTAAAPPVIIKIPNLTHVAAERDVASAQAYSFYRSAILPRGPPSLV